MDDKDLSRHLDSRDSRTQDGEAPHPVERRDIEDERWTETPPDNPVSAVDAEAKPSSFTMNDIEEGETPLDEDIDSMVDPSLGRERMSTNPDVLDLNGSWMRESEEPDFMQDPGTTDIIQTIEEGEPYFPPTDPPVRTGGRQNVEVMDGFSVTSLEAPTEPEEEPVRLAGDEEIAEQVRYALAADAYTGDLNIEVEVENGVVFLHGKVRSLEDIEQAEQVAGSVAGVDEVEEDLEIV